MKKNKIAGKFKIIENIELILINNCTGEIIEHDKISNLIVNSGLEYIAKLLNGVSLNSFKYIAIGEGATAPSVSNTQLVDETVRYEATCSYEADYKAKYQKTFTFDSGEEYAITELGIFDSLTPAGSHMLNRSTFSAKAVNADISLVVTVIITASAL